ncbi:uncharacterized protein LOC111016623 [Momordica charantia]|uniref:Uncharacterized protein LOC111016623 n=1 Tax=Momordica charantia TaxID=3673 RepID=A0A6J1D278_MOMCH|nr:uncharacterized protein LOC111016623 [Momordica charantia]
MKHDHRQVRSRVVGQIIKTNFEDPNCRYRPKDIVNDMRKNYDINIQYEKAWRAKEVALDLLMGSPKKSYTLLRKYGEALKFVNPGTIFNLKLEDDKYFQYAFMALGCSIRGFRSCIRSVLVIDGAHLKGKYKGVILIASSVDGNNQIYPVAFGIVDKESDNSWTWFLDQVKSAIGEVDGLVFVSDRHQAINNSVANVFPNAEHVSCMHHIKMNLNDKFKNEGMQMLYLQAAQAFKKSTFRYYWNQLAGFPEVQRYLQEVGFDKWSRAYQPELRYNQMTTNIAESMNAVLVHARALPVTALLENCRVLLQRWFYERRTHAATITSCLTEYAEDILRQSSEQARRHTIRPIDNYEFEVHDGSNKVRVNLNSKTCSCKQFDYYQIPCSHAIAAAVLQNVNRYTLCSSKYKLETLITAYAEPIYPLGNEEA